MHLEFEQEITELEEKIKNLKALPIASQLKIQDEIEKLEKKANTLLRKIYKELRKKNRRATSNAKICKSKCYKFNCRLHTGI